MKKIIFGALAVTFLSSGAFAADDMSKKSAFKLDPKFYVGGSIVRSSVDTGISAGTATLDEKDLAYKVYGGVQLNKVFGAEAHFADLGEASLKGNNGSTFTYKGTNYAFNQSADIDISAKSFGLGLTAGYEFGIVRPFAKLGIHRWNLDAKLNAATTSGDASDSGTDAFFGLGAEVNIYKGLNIRAEAERFKIDSYNVDVLTVGMNYRF